jgi:peptide deformylase
VPKRRGKVKRPTYVKVRAQNEKGETIIIEAKGYLARILSHEIDHLDGILFVDRVE